MSSHRPTLRPGTPVLRRTDGCLQVGLEGAGGLVVDGLGAAGPRLLAALDGTTSMPALRALADVLGTPQARVDGLLAQLHRHGHLLQAVAGPSHPARAAVAVDGSGPAARTLADLLTRTGLAVADGTHLAEAVLATHDAAPAGTRGDPVVVLLRRGALDAREARGLVRAGIPHLPVVLGETSLVVGPLVDRASAPGGPCLECCDLTRADLDPGWAGIHAQLLPVGVAPGVAVGGDGALDAIAASLTTMVVRAHVGGEPDRPGVAHEVRLPWPRVVARQWPAHSACSCRARTSPQQRDRLASVTMAG